ncbi:MAG: alginate lyase family protein [Mesorhizobium sp.]
MRQRIEQAGLLWHTVRHLKPIQIGGRIWFRLYRPKPDLRAAPPLREPCGAWTLPARRRPSQTGPERFRFLNRDGDLSRGWDDPGFDKLWRYNLHYFDDLKAEDAVSRASWHEALVARWIAENPPADGSGWEPYPTSLRIVNWIKWALSGNTLLPGAVQSLAVQTRWLSRRLEYHLLGNHLFANAKALVFAGCFFAGPEAEAWLGRGMRILAREVPEQILADGGQFELSPMYHALAVEDMLDLVNAMRTAGLTPPEVWQGKIDAMRDWLATMCHPDGEIAFFNDTAIGVAPPPAELERYARRLGCPALSSTTPGCRHLADSGYIRLQNERAVVLIDVARIGPDYLPGHAHADTLSFELSLDGQRAIVNSGTSVYGTGPERLRQRGTAAHNTVNVAGRNSSEVWSGFRVARRARPFGLVIKAAEQAAEVECGHDGYAGLAGRPLHRRMLKLLPDGLDVTDSVAGGTHAAEARFHVHPDWTVSASADGGEGAILSPKGWKIDWQIETGHGKLQASLFHPEFGVGIPSTCLAVGLAKGQSLIRFRW